MKKLLTFAAMLAMAATMSAQVTFTVKGGSNYKASNNEGCESAFDHNLGTKWLGNKDAYVIFEASEAVQFTGYTFVTANDNDEYGRVPKEWEIFGSNDAGAASDKDHSSWTSVQYVRGDNVMQHANYTSNYYAMNTAKAYKYYKLKVVWGDGNNDSFQISEFVPSYVPAFVPSYVAIDGVGGTGNEGYKSICDGNTSSKVCTDSRYESPMYDDLHQYFIFRRNEAVAVTKYKFCTANDFDNRDPKNWKLYGKNTNTTPSNDDEDWVLIDEKTDQSLPTDRFTWQEFTVGSPTENTYNTFLLRITKVRDGGDMTQFEEFRLNDDTSGYEALAGVGGTGGEGYAKGFDGDETTKVCTNSRVTSGYYAYWFIFKTSEDIAVATYKFATGNDANSRDPQSWSLYGMKSNSDPARDASGWTLIDTKTDVNDFPTDRTAWVHYDVDDPTADEYNYFKLEVTKIRSGNAVQFSEFNIDGWDVTYENKMTVYRCMGTWGDGAGANLFDGSSDTKWGGGFSTEGNGSYLTFGPANQEAISITGYSMQTADENGNYGRRPKSWTLYGGNNTTAPENDADWEVIHTVDGDADGAPVLPENYRACIYIPLDKPSKAYKYFKLKVTATQGTGGLQIGEFTLFYNHGVTPWMELRDDTAPVFNGVPNVANFKLDRSFATDRWYTFCSPVALAKSNFSEVKELTGVAVNGDNYTMTFSNANEIVAGKPYMVKVSSDKSELTASNVEVATIATPVKVEDGSNSLTFNGVLASGYAPLNSFIISNNVFYNVDTANTVALGAFRGYITTNSGSSVKAINFDFEDDATGISLMEDGRSQMEDGAIYNVAGQRLNKMQKGINIVNGKKILK